MLSFKLKVFLEVARQLSFTKASLTLFISQPAVTRHIQQLEDQYKVSLFERRGNSVTLSESGTVLLEHLTRAKDIEKQLEFELYSHNNKQRIKGELKLGASTTVALYIIPSVLSGFRKSHPEVNMSLLNRNSENIIKALIDHEIDLGIVEGKKKMGRVMSEPFLTDEVIPVCSAGSHLAKKTKLPLNKIKEIPVALREHGSGTLSALKQELSNHGIKLSDLNISLRLGGTEALKNFVLADESLGFLPMRAVKKEIDSGELVRIYIQGLTITRQFFFTQRLGDTNNNLNKAFIRFAKTYYNIKL